MGIGEKSGILVDGTDSARIQVDGTDSNSHVVGWYMNARVYREWQSAPSGSKRTFRSQECGYYVAAAESDCKRLDPDARTLSVPKAREVEGGMGCGGPRFLDRKRRHP